MVPRDSESADLCSLESESEYDEILHPAQASYNTGAGRKGYRHILQERRQITRSLRVNPRNSIYVSGRSVNVNIFNRISDLTTCSSCSKVNSH